MHRRTYTALLTTILLVIIYVPHLQSHSVEIVESTQQTNSCEPVLSTPKLNIFLRNIYNSSSFNIVCIFRNTRITPLLIDDLSLPLDTLDFEITTPNGQTLYYTGCGGGKRDPRTIFLLPLGFYIDIVDITRYAFGNSETQNYSFTDHPGEYHINAMYQSTQHVGVWHGRLESPIRTFVVNDDTPDNTSKSSPYNTRAGVPPYAAI